MTNTEQIGAAVKHFCATNILPYANEFDANGKISDELISKLGAAGYLGATIPLEYGGNGWNQEQLALLNEEAGKACSSVRSLLTVHLSLVAETLNRWGTEQQKARLLPQLCTGKKIAAFALSEPDTGSDAKNIQTQYYQEGDTYILNGQKKWITFGQLADVFLVFAKNGNDITAFLLNKDTPGLTVMPVNDMMGTKAAMMAALQLDNCKVAANAVLGKPGWGFMQVVNTALDNGRFSVATGTLGIAKACLEESIAYANTRKQFGVFLREHQLIKQKIARMTVNVKAASMFCLEAARERDNMSPYAVIKTSVAKYFTTTIASEAADDAVRIRGASGLLASANAQRYLRDTRVMEIIEGSTEIQQLVIADFAVTDLQGILNTAQ